MHFLFHLDFKFEVSSQPKQFYYGRKFCNVFLSGWCLYFILPVCQETIWEAFKIFWDRLPEQEEYQSWMNQCQEGTVTAQDIGSYFSESEEHQTLVKKVSG